MFERTVISLKYDNIITFNGHEFEQTPGGGNGQRSLVCCSPWGRKELDVTEWLNNYPTLQCPKLDPWVQSYTFIYYQVSLQKIFGKYKGNQEELCVLFPYKCFSLPISFLMLLQYDTSYIFFKSSEKISLSLWWKFFLKIDRSLKGNLTPNFGFINLRFLISSGQSLSGVQLFATLWTAAGQASLSITNS